MKVITMKGKEHKPSNDDLFTFRRRDVLELAEFIERTAVIVRSFEARIKKLESARRWGWF